MPDSHDPIQQLLISARRTQILDAATTVFAEKGFHHATIKDIARQAGKEAISSPVAILSQV